MKHLHLPLEEGMHQQLIQEAQRSGQAATTLVREAVARLLRERQQAALDAELDAYIAQTAGSQDDLDPLLEEAALEALHTAR